MSTIQNAIRRGARLCPDVIRGSVLANRLRGRRFLGYWPRLLKPRSFNEKVFWLKTYYRHPDLPKVADKILVRDYVAERLGKMLADELVLPILWSGVDPNKIPFDLLEPPYVVKVNHGTASNLFVKRTDELDREKVVAICNHWLSKRFGHFVLEWQYSRIAPQVFVEPFIGADSGECPPDFKFLCFNGRVELIQVDCDRHVNHTRAIVGRDYSLMDVEWVYSRPRCLPQRPARFDEMVSIAEALAAPFPLMRVDLYYVAGRIFCGELTAHPEGGLGPFRPQCFDFQLGSKLALPDNGV